MPGRSSPPTPLRSLTWCSSAFTSVPLRVPGRRMHDHPRRLVDHDDVGVLVDDAQRQASGCGGRRTQLGNVDDEALRRRAPACWRARALARGRGDVAFLDQPLDLRARLVRAGAPSGTVEPQAVVILGSTDERVAPGVESLIDASRGAPRRGAASGRAPRAGQDHSMTMLSGTMSTETNCDVESVADHAAAVAAVELDDEARDPVEQHVAPERPARERPALAFDGDQERRG